MFAVTRTLGVAATSLALVIQPVHAKAEKPITISHVSLKPACPDGGEAQGLLLGLLGAIIAPLAKAGVEGIGNALKKAGTPKDKHIISYGSGYFYSVTLDPTKSEKVIPSLKNECIVFAYGASNGRNLKSIDELAVSATAKTDIKNLGFVTEPAIYAEFGMEVSKDRTAFRLDPKVIWVGRPVSKRGFASKKRDLIITVSFSFPSTDDGSAFASRTVVLKGAPTSKLLTSAQLESLKSQWMPMPAMPQPISTRVQSTKQRLDDIQELRDELKDLDQTTSEGKARKRVIDREIARLESYVTADGIFLAEVAPINTRVDLHETRDGDAVLSAIGSFLADNAEGISTPIVNTIDPNKIAEAKEADLSDAVSAVTDENTVRVAAINEVAAWQEVLAKDDATEAQKRVARLRAERACKELALRGFSEVNCLLLVK